MAPLPRRTPDALPGPEPDIAGFFAVSLDMLCIRDADFRFVKVNPAWETALGYRVEELEGRPMLDFIHPDDRPASHGHMQRLERETEVDGFINRYRCRDGSYRHLEWRARRVGDLVYGVARDVTERLAIEAEMAAARAAAEAANRAKSDFLANMSHEIRTPLNGVIGVAAALAQTELADHQREMVELIARSGGTLERLVSDILDLSKIEAGRLEIEVRPFDLRAELDGVVEVFRLRAEDKGLAFRAEHGAAARGEFLGDAVRLKQVAGNLLSNAVKFTAHGEVAVRLDVEDGCAGAPARLTLEVRDTGVGFDEAFAARLFQRFSQADTSITRRFGGSGLGLSISQALAEMMGGELQAASVPGRGSVFRLVLPLPRHRPLAEYDAGSAAPEPPSALALPERAGPLRILLAEDHPTNRRVVELILQPLGVELVAVEDGALALEAYRAGTFDLVLMDMQMPVMDGLAATRAIRGHETAAGAPRTPLIVLSANAMRQHREDARAAGADLHLAKPITARALVEAMARALEPAA
ncbi:ATP-binding protein [Phenylobacterium sp.]|uniref:ATP-binding protein n=1 Tax=Phenylobacterium sp. TaxID=1871053 RepID=UPI002D011CFD|nr:ATP-binding protein [Phenylobacterium sp.]HVI34065.1 ATP-binding protein [Phenylobacterium sp.]